MEHVQIIKLMSDIDGNEVSEIKKAVNSEMMKQVVKRVNEIKIEMGETDSNKE